LLTKGQLARGGFTGVIFRDLQRRVSFPSSYVGYGYAGGYYGYRSGYYRAFNTATVETVNYKQGSLTIDLVDATQKVLAWTANAEGHISNDALKNPRPAIDTLVTNMISPLPAAAR